MASFMKEYEHLQIQLKEIKSATNNFDENKVIGEGGFGKVYEGELCHSDSEKKSLVALKRLDRKHGQGDPQFWREITMLSRYRHENLISLLGYCIEEGEMILIYEHAARGSLERYLEDSSLTWTDRIKICLDAAKGLSFLHDPNERHQRALHCDIKSANILLDDNLNAKISDFGLSKMGSTGPQYSVIITNAVGTPGYCDPLYMETYQLTKESDVYSFGVVLFEVLSGKLCVENINGQLKVYVPFWKKAYEDKKLLERIVLEDLKKQMAPTSFERFADIAYQCLKRQREERPAMSLVVENLEKALEVQEPYDLIWKIPKEYQDIANAAVDRLVYRSLEELKELLSKEVLLNDGKKLFCINEKGQHIERIFIESCLNSDERRLNVKEDDDKWVNLRFPGGTCYYYTSRFIARVRGEYLTPHIPYTLNLVFQYEYGSEVNSYNPLRYKIDGEDETKVFIIYPSTHLIEDGWFVVPLYHFTSQHPTADLRFEFEKRYANLLVVGFEFQPSEDKVELPAFEEYQGIVEAASQSLFYTSLHDLEQILFKGVHLDGYKTWFSLNVKGEHCHMISMEDCLIPNEDVPPQYQSHWQSRFQAGLYQTNNKGFKTNVKTQLLSPSITYTINLISSEIYVDLKYKLRGEKTTSTVYLSNWRSEEHLYMAELFQFTSDGSIVDLEIDFDDHATNLYVEGILFQPLEIVEDKASKDDKVENIQTISDSESDTYWENKLPNDYEEIINLSKDSLMWTTKKELYSILRRGFLINNGQQWFTVDKHGKKCVMLFAKATCVIYDKNSACKSPNETRFQEHLVMTAGYKFEFESEIEPTMLSLDTKYASYLVYKLPQDQSSFESPLKGVSFYSNNIYLVSPPNTPFIGQKLEENSYNPLNRHKLSALPRQRGDGWMEVKVWGFETEETPETVSMKLKVEHPGKKDLGGLIIQGIEIRPI